MITIHFLPYSSYVYSLTIVSALLTKAVTVFDVRSPDELYLYSALLKFFIYVSLFPLKCSPTLKTNYAILPTGITAVKEILLSIFDKSLTFMPTYYHIFKHMSIVFCNFFCFFPNKRITPLLRCDS